FSINKSWTYSWLLVTTDSTGKTLTSNTDTISVRIASVSDSLGTFTHLIRYEAASLHDGSETVWYQLAGDSLIEVAYSNYCSVLSLPKTGTATRLQQKYQRLPVFSLIPNALAKILNTCGIADSILFRDEYRTVYKYPLSSGMAWTSCHNPFLETRNVVGTETLQINNLFFSCAKIQTQLPTINPNIIWYDYVSSEGLIKRSIDYGKVTLTSVENPDSSGWGYSRENLTLMY
ncbi:MAG TPA: hypothetical protein VMU30_04295, partial [Bacteroidota bacterium]|nr:hypothetical protein [Bacteroidota bacterium]